MQSHDIIRKTSSGSKLQHCFRDARDCTQHVVPARPMLYCWAKPSALSPYNFEFIFIFTILVGAGIGQSIWRTRSSCGVAFLTTEPLKYGYHPQGTFHSKNRREL